jgi:uncharacterized protein (TIRG00374 family)
MNFRNLTFAVLMGILVYAGFAVYGGLEAIGGRLREFHWIFFAGACALAMCNYLLRFLKWEYYLKVLGISGVPKFDSLLIFFSGFTLTVTPGKLGEMFKSLLLRHSHGVPAAITAPVVVAERLTDVLAIVILIVLGSLGFAGGLLWAGIGGLFVAICLAVIMSEKFSRGLVRLVERLPGRAGALGPKVREAWESLRTMTRPRALLIPAAISVAAWACEGIALWVILRGWGQGLVPLAPAVFFYAVSTLAGAIIPVPGGLGVTEGFMEEQMRLIGGVPRDTSTAAMILIRFATLWFAVLCGFASLSLFRMKFPSKV